MHSAILTFLFFLNLSCLSLISAHPVGHGTISYSHDHHIHHHHHHHHRHTRARSDRARQRLQPETPLSESGLQNLAPDHQITINMEEPTPNGVPEEIDSNPRMTL